MVRSGFTLVELIATMVVLATLAGLSALILSEAGGAIGEARARDRAVTSATWAVDRILAEIRGVAESAPGEPGIASVSPTGFTSNAGLSISLVGESIEMEDAAGAETLCDDVDALALTYLDAEGVVIDPTDADAPRRVRRVAARVVVDGLEVQGLTAIRSAFTWRDVP